MRKFHRIIVEQTRHTRGQIGDMLDTGRIESGTFSVAPEPSEVAALVERARSTFPSGGGRHVVLVDLPACLPPVMADRRRIVHVLNNLFANATDSQPLTLRGRTAGGLRTNLATFTLWSAAAPALAALALLPLSPVLAGGGWRPYRRRRPQAPSRQLSHRPLPRRIRESPARSTPQRV